MAQPDILPHPCLADKQTPSVSVYTRNMIAKVVECLVKSSQVEEFAKKTLPNSSTHKHILTGLTPINSHVSLMVWLWEYLLNKTIKGEVEHGSHFSPSLTSA